MNDRLRLLVMGKYATSVKIINNILKAIIMTGLAGAVVVAPSALILGDKALRELDKRESRRKLRSTLSYMQRKSLINYREMSDGNLKIKISAKGKKRISKVEFDDMQIPKQEKWDGKWRLVMFDIPEHYRKSRSALSRKLRLMGFHQLQKSAWIYPYPCQEQIEIVRRVFSVSLDEIVLAEVVSIDQKGFLKKKFNL